MLIFERSNQFIHYSFSDELGKMVLLYIRCVKYHWLNNTRVSGRADGTGVTGLARERWAGTVVRHMTHIWRHISIDALLGISTWTCVARKAVSWKDELLCLMQCFGLLPATTDATRPASRKCIDNIISDHSCIIFQPDELAIAPKKDQQHRLWATTCGVCSVRRICKTLAPASHKGIGHKLL